MLLDSLLRVLVREGELVVRDHRGRVRRYGSGGTPVVLRLCDAGIERRLGMQFELALGEGYMEDRIRIEEGSLYDLLALLAANYARLRRRPLGRAMRAFEMFGRRWHQFNPPTRARRNVAHHYDLSNRFYRLFLDADMQYSCAYFQRPEMSLEEAQQAKKRHIAAKLLLRPGMRVLDIGCGWGGLALYLAERFDVEVTGLTLSTEQLELARERAVRRGLADRVRFELQDYRLHRGSYDRIVSVGMFEHVGVNHFRSFFSRVEELLEPDGVMLLHSIGRMDGPSATSPWIRKYIFPGGYIPALSEVLPSIEQRQLWTTDVEILRLHYAETLRAWRERFLRHRREVLQMYDERFCRMWEYYLVASEVFFRHLGGMVFQLQLARRRDAVPLTRDYILDSEQELRDPVFHAAE